MFEAGACLSALELGGMVGGLCGGFLSDTLFGGRRGPIMCSFRFGRGREEREREREGWYMCVSGWGSHRRLLV